jgi:hypothetical protein
MVQRWLAALPADLVAARPRLLLIQAALVLHIRTFRSGIMKRRPARAQQGSLVIYGTAFYDTISFNDLWAGVQPR